MVGSHVADDAKQALSYIRGGDSVLIVGSQPVEMARIIFGAFSADIDLCVTILNTTGQEISGLCMLQSALQLPYQCKELCIESFEYLCGPARYYHSNRFDVLLYILSENEDAAEIVRQAKLLVRPGGDVVCCIENDRRRDCPCYGSMKLG